MQYAFYALRTEFGIVVAILDLFEGFLCFGFECIFALCLLAFDDHASLARFPRECCNVITAKA